MPRVKDFSEKYPSRGFYIGQFCSYNNGETGEDRPGLLFVHDDEEVCNPCEAGPFFAENVDSMALYGIDQKDAASIARLNGFSPRVMVSVRVQLDEDDSSYAAYWNWGTYWNGWVMPCLLLESMREMVKKNPTHFRENPDGSFSCFPEPVALGATPHFSEDEYEKIYPEQVDINGSTMTLFVPDGWCFDLVE